MLTKGDDFPIHQLPEPVAVAGSDRNFYDRYFFNGYKKDGSVFFACALGVYPHLNIIDASFSVIMDGKQRNLRASRILGMERMDTRVGPISIEVLEPLETLRLRVACPEHDLRAELTFHHRHPAICEPRFTHRVGPRLMLDYTRMTQNGLYRGWLEVGNERIIFNQGDNWGTRDRSWGIRPIGAADPQPVAPPPLPQFYWLWSPLNFDDACLFYHVNSDADGNPWNTKGVLVPVGGGDERPLIAPRSMVRFKPGTRHARQAQIDFQGADGKPARIELTPHWQFSMSGIGYMHPEWGHGHYKGENALGYDEHMLADRAPEDLLHLHCQAFVTARLHDGNGQTRDGIGVLEQLIIGPHHPSGFHDLFDMAPADDP